MPKLRCKPRTRRRCKRWRCGGPNCVKVFYTRSTLTNHMMLEHARFEKYTEPIFTVGDTQVRAVYRGDDGAWYVVALDKIGLKTPIRVVRTDNESNEILEGKVYGKPCGVAGFSASGSFTFRGDGWMLTLREGLGTLLRDDDQRTKLRMVGLDRYTLAEVDDVICVHTRDDE